MRYCKSCKKYRESEEKMATYVDILEEFIISAADAGDSHEQNNIIQSVLSVIEERGG